MSDADLAAGYYYNEGKADAKEEIMEYLKQKLGEYHTIQDYTEGILRDEDIRLLEEIIKELGDKNQNE